MRRILSIVAPLCLAAACDDPTIVREPPELRELAVFMILEPAEPMQPVLVRTAAPVGTVMGLEGEILRGGVQVAATPPYDPEPSDLAACGRYGGIYQGLAFPVCLELAFRPAFATTYSVRVGARDRPSVVGEVTTPGDFRIAAARVSSYVSGDDSVNVTWTRSAGAHRYSVMLHRRLADGRAESVGWRATAADTTLAVALPRGTLPEGASGRWYVEVQALDPAIYQFLTTGSVGDLFPVTPAQNVTGGYGVVGARVRRFVEVNGTAGSLSPAPAARPATDR